MSARPDVTAPAHGIGLRTSRIEALTDGVFAIAMTLLVLDLRVPQVSDPAVLPGRLLDLWPKFLSYVISFVILGVYWVGHHNQFHWIKRSDRILTWITVAFLLCVTFVPFTASLLGDYPGQAVGLTLYGLNLILTGLLLYAHWAYATWEGRLVESPIDDALQTAVRRRILTGPAVYLVAILLAFVVPAVSLAIYVVTPLLYIFPNALDRHWTAPHRLTRGA